MNWCLDYIGNMLSTKLTNIFNRILVALIILVVAIFFTTTASAENPSKQKDADSIEIVPPKISTPFATPAQGISTNNEQEMAKSRLREESKKWKKMMADYDPNFEPTLEETPISEEEQRKLFGDPVEYYEVPEEDQIEGCMYTPGFAEPSWCFDKNNKPIYKAGGNPKILEKLKAEHKQKREMIKQYYKALQTMSEDRN